MAAVADNTVLAVYGAKLVPNDLDVTPDLDSDNLERLATVLTDIDATPAYHPHWTDGPDLDECRAWTPHPATKHNLGHQFVTRFGMLDVPPRLCGTYRHLITDAAHVDIGGTEIAVCAPSEVRSRLHGRNRPRDQQRAAIYRQLADRPPTQLAPVGDQWQLEHLDPPPNDGRVS